MAGKLVKATAALALSILAPVALANFHISMTAYIYAYGYSIVTFDFMACPSNDFTCNCFLQTDSGNGIDYNGQLVYAYGNIASGSLPSAFNIDNLCGVSQLNFYANGNMYVNQFSKTLFISQKGYLDHA
jgi:hypothetical protein